MCVLRHRHWKKRIEKEDREEEMRRGVKGRDGKIR
jgi:hypothetical protein